jgi:16S rRNA (uracil1498-N3)-methyltransferase
MRVSRIFVAISLQTGQQLELDPDSAHYVRSVLRLKPQDNLVLFNGQGGEYLCRLIEISRKSVSLSVNEFLDRNVESPINISLGMGISRGDRMDWAVQKAVELGVKQLTPLVTERCVIKFSDEKKLQRLQHWRHIVQHAAEQCGRTHLPELGEIANLPDWVAKQSKLRLFLDPNAELSIPNLQPDGQDICLLSGPEGGFSDQERQIALTAGFIPVRMGARILRTETAVLAALTAVQTLWGDFN